MTDANHLAIEGKDYPCRQTAGALLRFKRETGYDLIREPSRLDSEGLTVLAWAACKSACAADGVEFGFSLEEFADRLGIDDISAWYLAVQKEQEQAAAADSKKK